MRKLLTDNVVFAESPRWHRDRLWFSDVYDFALKTVDLDGTVQVVTPVPGRPAGLGVLPDGNMLLATAIEGRIYSVSEAGAMSTVADLSARVTGLLNDMVVDSSGRAYVGDTGFHTTRGDPFQPGFIFLVIPGQEPEVVAEDVHLPNGCAITADGRTLYVAETAADRISRFAIAGDGRLSSRAIHVELPSAPDGLCLDAEGALWVALPHAGEFVRTDAAGAVVERLESPFALALTCVLGGPDRRLLFLSSADTTLERVRKGDSRGRIDVLAVPTPGAGLP